MPPEEETKEPVEVEEEIKEPDYVTYDRDEMTLFEIFGEYGTEKAEIAEIEEANKKLQREYEDWCERGKPKTEEKDFTPQPNPWKHTLYYDFTPFNSKDPVLLSLNTAKDNIHVRPRDDQK